MSSAYESAFGSIAAGIHAASARAEALDMLDADTRIPPVSRCGEYLYNFWRDASRPRGVWRRIVLEEYRNDSPEWDVVIDVDALAADEDENWVWGGAGVIEPEYTRALVGLSRGGADANVVREFDMVIVVRPSQHIDEAELKALIAQRLAKFKVPRVFEFVDELPRTATGKVLRRKLL
jgi:prolyl oligopeptidase PreP (S9A serine peptidase family)